LFWASLHSKLWRIVLIMTIQAFYMQFSQGETNGSKLWVTGLLYHIVLDEAPKLWMCGTQIGKFSEANAPMVTMDSHNYTMHMISYILSLELKYLWMLWATPWVSNIQDMRWILCNLVSSFWLTFHLLPDIFGYTSDIDNHGVPDRTNVSISEHGDRFIPVADPYKKGL